MSSDEVVEVAVKRAGVHSPECIVALAGLSGRNYRSDWKRANLEQKFDSNSYFNANAEHRERIVNALFLMRQEAVFGSFEETMRRVLSPSEALPHELHLGQDEWSFSDGILEYAPTTFPQYVFVTLWPGTKGSTASGFSNRTRYSSSCAGFRLNPSTSPF